MVNIPYILNNKNQPLDHICTALSTHSTTWNTCCHNTAKLVTMYF